MLSMLEQTLSREMDAVFGWELFVARRFDDKILMREVLRQYVSAQNRRFQNGENLPVSSPYPRPQPILALTLTCNKPVTRS